MSETEGAAEGRKEPRVIKRYSNRKLYDTVKSAYVRLEDIAKMVQAGTEVQVVDNQTKEDLTSVTLAQIIFEEEKSKRNRMPLTMLRDIVRHGGESLSHFIDKEVTPRVATIREEAEGLRDRLLKRDAELKDAKESKEGRAGGRDAAKDFVAASQRALEDLQKKIDERVRTAVEGLFLSLPAVSRDVQAIEKKLADLEAKVAQLERRS